MTLLDTRVTVRAPDLLAAALIFIATVTFVLVAYDLHRSPGLAAIAGAAVLAFCGAAICLKSWRGRIRRRANGPTVELIAYSACLSMLVFFALLSSKQNLDSLPRVTVEVGFADIAIASAVFALALIFELIVRRKRKTG